MIYIIYLLLYLLLPITYSGLVVTEAILVKEIEEVLEAKIASLGKA